MIKTYGQRSSILGWKAWYVGGEVFTSRATRWSDLPKKNALWINVYLANGTVGKMSGEGHCFFKLGNVYRECSNAGFKEALNRGWRIEQAIEINYPGAEVINGKWPNNAESDRVFNLAKDDKEFVP